MKHIFHDGEEFFQKKLNVQDQVQQNKEMFKENLPAVAVNFLESLQFCVISLVSKNNSFHTFSVYDLNNFIKVINDKSFSVSLENSTFISNNIDFDEILNIGFIGIDFEYKMRIRINGTCKFTNKELKVNVDCAYSNCPAFITKRKAISLIQTEDKPTIHTFKVLNNDLKNHILNADTFFISSYYENSGVDVSHKGGKNGFLHILSDDKLIFEDSKGNNFFNTLGNIHKNNNVDILIIDFSKNNILLINAVANIKEERKQDKITFFVEVLIKNIQLQENYFKLRYIEK